jgi:hypothetical protein
MGLFIGNLLKLNARQLMNKKSKRKKSNASSFLSFSNATPTLNNPIITTNSNINSIAINQQQLPHQPSLTTQTIQPLQLNSNTRSPIIPGSARQAQSDRLTDIITSSTFISNTADLSKALADVASSVKSKANTIKDEDDFKTNPCILIFHIYI